MSPPRPTLEAVRGEVLSEGSWSPQQAAGHVSESWQSAVESIVETGRRLIEAKQRVPHGRWSAAVELMPFGESTARRLMQIASHPDLANRAHARDLPASWYTLAVLAQLPEGEIPKRIEAGEITPEVDRATVEGWVNTYSLARQEAMNAYGEAWDGLVAVLSWWRSGFTPPDEGPASHMSAAAFLTHIRDLYEIATAWEETHGHA